jgi:DnaJ-class molecular chaperone
LAPKITATTTKQVPVRCPICEGTGYIDLDTCRPPTADTICDPEPCPKCKGERVLWVSEQRTEYLPG